jgi:hypothetical protein
MSKISEMLKLNKNYIIIVDVLLTIVVYVRFFELMSTLRQHSKNFADLVFYIIGDMYIVLYILTLAFMILILYVSKKDIVNSYILMKYKSKKIWYINQILLIFLYALTFVLFIIFLCVIVSAVNVQISNEWSNFAKFIAFQGNPIISESMIKYSSPFVLLIYNAIFLMLFLFMNGLLYFIINFLTKNNMIGFVVTYSVTIVLLSLVLTVLQIEHLYILSPFKNVIISEHSIGYGDIKYNPTLMFSFLYFIIVNCVLIILGYQLLKRIELKFGDKKL